MKPQLSQISDLITGYSFRNGMPYSEASRTRIVQAADVRPNGSLPDPEELRSIEDPGLSTAAFLIQGDVVLVSRSSPDGGFRAASVIDKPSVPYLAASALTVIRPKPGKIDPRYLSAYLNSTDGQAALQRIASGSSIRTLRLKELAELPIPIPDPTIQKTLVALAGNINEQKDLIDRKRQLLDSILSTITSTNR